MNHAVLVRTHSDGGRRAAASAPGGGGGRRARRRSNSKMKLTRNRGDGSSIFVAAESYLFETVALRPGLAIYRELSSRTGCYYLNRNKTGTISKDTRRDINSRAFASRKLCYEINIPAMGRLRVRYAPPPRPRRAPEAARTPSRKRRGRKPRA
ncbi:hypothetical protein EVAR_52629_1 [Eumeta japonica]|uniref:Uncharacterized protein n=1 Tax=Eumeta variegata TaxID=151549 RepID=A0A4C1XXZ0_EUMVA|nr:hypothetical protein EVAR_52629_1 [Eumeta japonica]